MPATITAEPLAETRLAARPDGSTVATAAAAR